MGSSSSRGGMGSDAAHGSRTSSRSRWGRMKEYEWPNFRYAGKRALYVRDDDGVMRRVGTVHGVGRTVIRLAGRLYTINQLEDD